jgi:uncharacterized repeat protein (TIGR01451 family)
MKCIRILTIIAVFLLSLGLVSATLAAAKVASANPDPDPQNLSRIQANQKLNAPNVLSQASGKLFAGTGKFISDSGMHGNDYAYEIDVTTNISHELFSHRPVSGATFDSTNDRVLFTSSGSDADGSDLYSWSSATMTYTLLGAVSTITGEVRVDGLAMSGGVLYGDVGIDSANGKAGLYEIDQNTLTATRLFTFTNTAISGIDADPITGKIYGVDDGQAALIEIGLDGTITKTVDYPPGQNDIDGLAVDPDHNAYLITDEPGLVYIYNLVSHTFATLKAPWVSADDFSAGAFLSDPQIAVNPTSLSSTQYPDQVKDTDLTISNTGLVSLTWTIQEDDSTVNVCSSPTPISWLDLDRSSGSTDFKTHTVVGTTFDSSGLSNGVYTGTLCITSNDPATSLVTIPVTLTVQSYTYAVNLSSDQTSSGAPGDIVTYTVQVTNTSPDTADTFDLDVSDVWGASLSRSSIALGIGASTTFTVDVTIPSGAGNGDMDVATVTATSQGDAGVSDTAQLTTTAVVVPVYAVNLSPNQAISGEPGDTVIYTVQITNTSPNAADTFDLGVSGGWGASLSRSSIALGIGASTTFTVEVGIPPGASDGDIDVATVTATSQGDAGVSDTTQLTTTAVVVPVYAVNLSPNQTSSGGPGNDVIYTVQITNTSPNVADTFDLSVSGVWGASLSKSSVTLGIGASTTFTVEVGIPPGASDGDMDVATVTATSQGDAGVSDTTQLTTTAVVAPVYAVKLSPNQASSGWPGEVVTYTLQITNTSPNVADTFALSVSGVWGASLSKSSVTLGKGSSTTFTVQITIPSGAADGDMDVTTVTATSQGDTSVSDTMQLTTTSSMYKVHLPVLFGS